LKALPGHDDYCLGESLFKKGSGWNAPQILLTTQVSHHYNAAFVVLGSLVDPSFSSPSVDRAVECYNSNLNYIHRNSPNQKNFYHISRKCSLMRDRTERKVYSLKAGNNHFKTVLTVVIILCAFLPVDMRLHLCVLSSKFFVMSTPPDNP
jgi:hypothetical protein